MEIFLSGVWGTISDSRPLNPSGPSNAAVVCRQLGYKANSKKSLNKVPKVTFYIIPIQMQTAVAVPDLVKEWIKFTLKI